MANRTAKNADQLQPIFVVAKTGSRLRHAFWVFGVILVAAMGNISAAQIPSTAQAPNQGLVKVKASHRPVKPHATQNLRKGAGKDAPAADSSAIPKAALVTLQDGLLTVRAENSDLRQILDKIGALGSMSIEGQVGDARVYGSYGPGVPSAVISNLLEGAGYNVILAGVNELGVPRKLVLTPKIGGISPPSTPALASQSGQQENLDVNSPENDPLGPGAIANAPPPPSEDREIRMKQTLDRLQQMQDQQKDQQEPK